MVETTPLNAIIAITAEAQSTETIDKLAEKLEDINNLIEQINDGTEEIEVGTGPLSNLGRSIKSLIEDMISEIEEDRERAEEIAEEQEEGTEEVREQVLTTEQKLENYLREVLARTRGYIPPNVNEYGALTSFKEMIEDDKEILKQQLTLKYANTRQDTLDAFGVSDVDELVEKLAEQISAGMGVALNRGPQFIEQFAKEIQAFLSSKTPNTTEYKNLMKKIVGNEESAAARLLGFETPEEARQGREIDLGKGRKLFIKSQYGDLMDIESLRSSKEYGKKFGSEGVNLTREEVDKLVSAFSGTKGLTQPDREKIIKETLGEDRFKEVKKSGISGKLTQKDLARWLYTESGLKIPEKTQKQARMDVMYELRGMDAKSMNINEIKGILENEGIEGEMISGSIIKMLKIMKETGEKISQDEFKWFFSNMSKIIEDTERNRGVAPHILTAESFAKAYGITDENIISKINEKLTDIRDTVINNGKTMIKGIEKTIDAVQDGQGKNPSSPDEKV